MKISRNELADIEANRGSKLTAEVHPHFNKISRTEGYRLITDAAKKDFVNFPILSNPLYSKGIFPSNINIYSILVYRRLKLNNPLFKYFKLFRDVNCPHCEQPFELDHLTINACPTLQNEIGFIQRTLADNNLSVHDLLNNTNYKDWRDALYMCDIFRSSSIGHLL